MDLPSQEVEIPMPLNSAYGGAHVHGHVTNMIHDHGHDHDHHHHHHDDHPSPPPPSSQFQAPSSNGPPMPMTQNHDHHQHDHQHHHLVLSNNTKKQQVRYRECLKNHAASMGGNATDGCGEFMPSGEEGTIEFLTCSACNCHRNFHRKEVEGDHHIPSSNNSPLLYDCHNYQFTQPPPHHLMINSRGRKVINLGQHKNMFYPSSATPAGGPRMIPYTMGPLLIPPDDQSDDQEELGGGVAASDAVACRALPPPPPPPPSSSNQYYLHHSNHQHNQMMMMKKRFRTKFTAEQKEKMLSFAEKVGWKIQKQEESVVQQFCQEIGVKRRVLKVWMHNNKHNLAKKNSSISNA